MSISEKILKLCTTDEDKEFFDKHCLNKVDYHLLINYYQRLHRTHYKNAVDYIVVVFIYFIHYHRSYHGIYIYDNVKDIIRLVKDE